VIPFHAVLDHTYYVVELHDSVQPNVRQWLEERFGPEGTRWFTTYKKIYFAEDKDHVMFILRWS
jgi:hypothetical protein